MEKKFVVIADADCNFVRAEREKYGIDDFVPMVVSMRGRGNPR